MVHTECAMLLQAERNRSQRKQQFVSRTIFHPSFKNVSLPEAIALLSKEGETSRWLFRPSNKGTHQISITMKVPSLHPPLQSPLYPQFTPIAPPAAPHSAPCCTLCCTFQCQPSLHTLTCERSRSTLSWKTILCTQLNNNMSSTF